MKRLLSGYGRLGDYDMMIEIGLISGPSNQKGLDLLNDWRLYFYNQGNRGRLCIKPDEIPIPQKQTDEHKIT